MKYINRYRTGKEATAEDIGVKLMLFPDGQPHVILSNVVASDSVSIRWPVRSPLELFQLLAICNAIKNAGASVHKLEIPYLMGARSDRNMVPGDSIDIQVVANCINSIGARFVYLYDVHSDVSLKYINNSYNLTAYHLLDEYKQTNAVLVCPDKGAEHKVDAIMSWHNIAHVIYCDKSRDLETGQITLTVQTPEVVTGRSYVIVDDLCDGGGTFNAIAEQLKPYNPRHATLIVTHGVFSQGFSKLEQNFDEIITTNSFNEQQSEKLRTIKVC